MENRSDLPPTSSPIPPAFPAFPRAFPEASTSSAIRSGPEKEERSDTRAVDPKRDRHLRSRQEIFVEAAEIETCRVPPHLSSAMYSILRTQAFIRVVESRTRAWASVDDGVLPRLDPSAFPSRTSTCTFAKAERIVLECGRIPTQVWWSPGRRELVVGRRVGARERNGRSDGDGESLELESRGCRECVGNRRAFEVMEQWDRDERAVVLSRRELGKFRTSGGEIQRKTIRPRYVEDRLCLTCPRRLRADGIVNEFL